MATDWKVRYKDGRVQAVTAEKYAPVGDNHVFESEGVDIAVIARQGVESVTRADVPDPRRPAPKSTAV